MSRGVVRQRAAASEVRLQRAGVDVVEFSGLPRIRLVGRLVEAFSEAVQSRDLRVVTVESPAGWGKTRILQELYGQLAIRQPRPAYWPPSLDVSQRHCVFPDRVQPVEGARPAWFWWGWSCTRTSGTPGFAAAAAGEQVTAHLGGIAAAIAAGERLWRQRLSYAVTAATLLPTLGVLHDLADLIDKGADLAEVVTKARTVLRTRSGLITEALDRQGGRTIDVTGWSRAAAEVGQAADVLTAVSHLLPLVLVIDDAHDLDPVSLPLLATLRQRRLDGLIVLTACTRSPDREVVEGEFARWVSELARQDRVERHRLVRLDSASMAKILSL